MDWLYLLVVLTVIYFVVCFVLIVTGDCDILFQLAVKFGKKPGVLKNKIVWITGASSGIGENFAYELEKAGCRLILSARREGELERVKKECLSGHSNQQCWQRSNSSMGVELAVDRDMLELNVLGVLSLSRMVLPSMLERGKGHIVNMSSVAGKTGAPLSGSYTGTKHALQGWFDSLRIEVASRGVYVTNICPGSVFSNILYDAFTEINEKRFHGEFQPGESPMSTSRCAELSVIAIANKLDEVWISRNPVLLFMYMTQYFPNLGRFIYKKTGLSVAKKIREGKK